MKKIPQSLILVTLVFAQSYSAEHKVTKKKNFLELFIIKNLLIEMQSPLVVLVKKRTEHDSFKSFIAGIYLDEPKKSLVSLWNQQIDSHEFDLRFCPTIIRYDKGFFINLGSLDPAKHEEAKEACRIGHGVYLSCQQGAIIYNPKNRIKHYDDCWKDIIQQKITIQKMITDNQRKPIEL